jgi:nucleoside transporter
MSNPSSPRFKLSVMMLLQFFIWGAWLPVSFGYFGKDGLNFTEEWQLAINICFPVAAILGMIFANAFVDRNFAAEKFLAFSHLVGGIAMLGMGQVTDPAPFFCLMALHCLFYVPTISVTNAIAFAHLRDPQREFGPVRLWGTIGWIAAAWPFIFILVDWAKVPTMEAAGGFIPWLGTVFSTTLTGAELVNKQSMAFTVSGIASLLLAAFSLTLPHTPPKAAIDGQSSAGLGALRHLATPFILVLFIVTWIDATVHDGFFFFAFTYLGKVGVPQNWIQTAMSVGQIAEIGTMAMLAPVLAKLGWRTTMIIGVLGHAIRFAVFAMFPDRNLAVAVNVLHGICYAFFFATLYIFIDEYLPKDSRTSAQGLFNFLVLGMGPITSRFLWGNLQKHFTTSDGTNAVVDYSRLLLYPAGAALIGAIILLLFFHPPKHKSRPITTQDESSY